MNYYSFRLWPLFTRRKSQIKKLLIEMKVVRVALVLIVLLCQIKHHHCLSHHSPPTPLPLPSSESFITIAHFSRLLQTSVLITQRPDVSGRTQFASSSKRRRPLYVTALRKGKRSFGKQEKSKRVLEPILGKFNQVGNTIKHIRNN